MPAMGSLTLNTKVYTPRGTENGVASWALVGDTSFGGGLATVTESVRGPLSDGSYRTRWTMTFDKLATADSPCACVGSTLGKTKVDVVVTSSQALTAAERQDVADRFQALTALSVFEVSIATPEGSWG